MKEGATEMWSASIHPPEQAKQTFLHLGMATGNSQQEKGCKKAFATLGRPQLSPHTHTQL